MSLDSVLNNTFSRFEHFKSVTSKFNGLDLTVLNADSVEKTGIFGPHVGYSEVIENQANII